MYWLLWFASTNLIYLPLTKYGGDKLTRVKTRAQPTWRGAVRNFTFQINEDFKQNFHGFRKLFVNFVLGFLNLNPNLICMQTLIKRSMAFIDQSNLIGGWRDYCIKNDFVKRYPPTRKIELTKKLSYEKLISEITRDTDFIRGYFYDAIPELMSAKKEKFFDKLRSLGITIVTKKLRYKSVICKHCNQADINVPYQKGVDVSLVTDVMSLAFEDAYDIAIIVTGDNDFLDAINYIKSKGKKVWIVSFRASLGDDIMRAADGIIKLDNLFNAIVL